MKILTVDIGTGTQDIFLYNSRLDLENNFKLILPSPTMMVHRRIQQATRRGETILLEGVPMGGGPSQWAAEAHAKVGLPIFATPEAAKTFNDELDKVERMGIRVISADEAQRLSHQTTRIRLADFDFAAIAETFARFGVTLDDLASIAVAVFDHGNAPAGVSDRQFRFDYLDDRIKANNSLSAFAYLSNNIPAIMTRLQAVADSARGLPCPLIVMDTAPAAILGATFDPVVAQREQKLICNIGNFHTLAFRLGEQNIEGVFEHHTGEIDRLKLESLLRRLADGTLKHADVFDDMGHGALIYNQTPLALDIPGWDVAVTGPRRSTFNQQSSIENHQFLRPYYAAPFGDMMITGNIGLLAATADLLPQLKEPIQNALRGYGSGTAPWDA
jgi:uncharacterized protein (DUF1786 family)